MNIPSTHDSLLAALGQEPAESAWAAFHARYREVILAWCRRRGLAAEAEDLTQEIFLKLLRVLPQHVHDPEHGPFRSWLKTVVQNALRDYWRKNQRHPEPPGIGGSTFLGKLGNLANVDSDIEELSAAIGQRAEDAAVEIMNRARGRVGAKTWQAFLLTTAEGHPAAEVAQELGLTTATVFKHAYRVKQILLDEMHKGCCGLLGGGPVASACEVGGPAHV